MTRVAQVLLVVAAGALWGASRLVWVEVRSFDGLGQPVTTSLHGAQWSTGLVPLALMLLAAVLASLTGPTWQRRLLAVIVAGVSVVIGYLAISLWTIPDVAVRAARIAEVPVADLLGTQREYSGAALTLVAALLTLTGAVLLVRPRATAPSDDARYASPALRRAAVQRRDPDADMSERMIWDALDEGRDPTRTDTEGR